MLISSLCGFLDGLVLVVMVARVFDYVEFGFCLNLDCKMDSCCCPCDVATLRVRLAVLVSSCEPSRDLDGLEDESS